MKVKSISVMSCCVVAVSLLRYLFNEVTRGYEWDHVEEERYHTRRQKVYSFFKIPTELEKFIAYGFFLCLDSFLFVFTFLPIRFVLAIAALAARMLAAGLGLPVSRLLHPAEKIDLMKGLIIAICVCVMARIDTSMVYHLIKSQSVMKLYLFFNMLEVFDRLFSAFGQDTIDALFWTATEPRDRRRDHFGVIPHFILTIIYVILHSLLMLLQATTINVAINASNQALLTIMISNNFVEIKSSVFKKFDKNNLFQVSCSDVRERFQLFALIFIVVVQTMKEYGWKQESFWSLAPYCIAMLISEIAIDWIKHAFITSFNEVSVMVYKDYTIFMAYDLAQTKQKHAYSDHSDLVSRRLGFMPLPLGVVMIRVISNSIRGISPGAVVICILAYLCLLTFRILSSIVVLGKACVLIDSHLPPNENHGSVTPTEETDTSTNRIVLQSHSQVLDVDLNTPPTPPSRPNDQHQTSDSHIKDHNLAAAPESSEEANLNIIQFLQTKSQSSPDFTNFYQRPFDADRDWPAIDDEVCVDAAFDDPDWQRETSRRCSGMEDGGFKVRRRYDTNRL